MTDIPKAGQYLDGLVAKAMGWADICYVSADPVVMHASALVGKPLDCGGVTHYVPDYSRDGRCIGLMMTFLRSRLAEGTEVAFGVTRELSGDYADWVALVASVDACCDTYAEASGDTPQEALARLIVEMARRPKG